MNNFNFTNEHVAIMRTAAKLGHKGWDLKDLKCIKSMIKTKRKLDQKDTCCYCQRDITGEFNMVLDIEHILPKSERLKNMFTMKNLSVSCKRCNMQIKGAKTDFLVVPINNLPKRVFRSHYYKFAHPNLDKVELHIKRVMFQDGKVKIIKYMFPNKTEKGSFTYEYFRLKELEVDSANKAQGKKGKNKIADPKLQKAFNELLVQ